MTGTHDDYPSRDLTAPVEALRKGAIAFWNKSDVLSGMPRMRHEAMNVILVAIDHSSPVGGIFAFANRPFSRHEIILSSVRNDRCAESHKTESGHFCRDATIALRNTCAVRLSMGLAHRYDARFEGCFCASRQRGVADRRYAMAAANSASQTIDGGEPAACERKLSYLAMCGRSMSRARAFRFMLARFFRALVDIRRDAATL